MILSDLHQIDLFFQSSYGDVLSEYIAELTAHKVDWGALTKTSIQSVQVSLSTNRHHLLKIMIIEREVGCIGCVLVYKLLFFNVCMRCSVKLCIRTYVNKIKNSCLTLVHRKINITSENTNEAYQIYIP